MESSPLSTVFAFVSWDGSDYRRACPLAAFGGCNPAQAQPLALSARLVCVDPPRADQEELVNAKDVAGSIALVVRGGCSFAAKARRVQRAGAVAMVLANNTREAPLAAFTMAEEADEQGQPNIAIPCVMMCLLDVRQLFQKFPPSVQTGVLTLEVLAPEEAGRVAADSLHRRKEHHERSSPAGAWGVGALRRKTSALMKMLDPLPSTAEGPSVADVVTTSIPADDSQREPDQHNAEPLVGFVQWATGVTTFTLEFAPLADFCRAPSSGAVDGPLVLCDPVLADTDRIVNADALRGSIALVQRGACTFPAKLERVQACGAVAAIVGNDDERDSNSAFVMSVDSFKTDHITIPAVMVSRAVFDRLLAEKPARIRVLSVPAGQPAADLLAKSGIQTELHDGGARTKLFPLLDSDDDDDEDDEEGDGETALEREQTEAVEGLRELHAACRRGDHGACQRILDERCGDDEAAKKTLVQTRDAQWRAALHHACVGGNPHVVALLLQLGAAPFESDLGMRTALHVASANGHAECVEALLQAANAARKLDGEIDEQFTFITADLGGSTPIHLATIASSTDTLELLLTANARIADNGAYEFDGVNARNRDGETPLHLACCHTRASCAAYLLAANADVNSADSQGRTPLELACDLANDPDAAVDQLFIIEKLIASGAEMTEPSARSSPAGSALEVEAAETLQTNCRLVLDRIRSQPLKREVEVLYLRHEAQALRSRVRDLEKNRGDLRSRIVSLEQGQGHLLQQVTTRASDEYHRRTSYEEQIEQLQRQMGSLFQMLQVNGRSIGATTEVPLAPDALFSTHTNGNLGSDSLDTSSRADGDSLGKPGRHDEVAVNVQDLALDAGLARDLGKKLLRQQQFSLAEAYFAKSLDLLPLPGVTQLLEKARNLRCAPQSEPALADSRHIDRSIDKKQLDEAKTVIVQQLRRAVEAMDAPAQTKKSLEREIQKLEAMSDDSSEFALACKWLEWLTSLPWGDPTSGLADDNVWCGAEGTRGVFLELERIEREKDIWHLGLAARTIQQAYRKRFARRQAAQAAAAARIQAAYRRKHAGRASIALCNTVQPPCDRDSERSTPTASTAQGDGNQDVDFCAVVDPAALHKLQRQVALICGIRYSDGTTDLLNGTFRIVQLLRNCGGKNGSLHDNDPEAYYVWTRWCTGAGERSQGSVNGPYELADDARRRYDRLVAEAVPSRKVLHIDSDLASGNATTVLDHTEITAASA